MWLKKCTCFLLACVAVFGCLFTPVAAAELGEQKVEIEERRASGKFDFDIPAKTLMKASSGYWEAVFSHTRPLGVVPWDMRG